MALQEMTVCDAQGSVEVSYKDNNNKDITLIKKGDIVDLDRYTFFAAEKATWENKLCLK
jgi:hypothetical protein